MFWCLARQRRKIRPGKLQIPMQALLFFVLLQSPADTFKLANADMDAGRYADAAIKFEQILKEDPTHIPSQFDLAVCYAKLGKPEMARGLYGKIIEADPAIYEVRFNFGLLLREIGADDAADEQF